MVTINYAFREISCKIVYYGPGLSGKTTNLQYVHDRVPSKSRGDLISLATEADRTLFFDFLPIHVGDIAGFATKFQLYTVPGQVFYNATRKLVLRGVDGIVFVADSQAAKMDENIESLTNMFENLRENGIDPSDIPIVLQYNKRDLPDIVSIEELQKQLNPSGWPYSEASAVSGIGVFDTLKRITKMVLEQTKRRTAVTPDGLPQMGEGAQPSPVHEPHGASSILESSGKIVRPQAPAVAENWSSASEASVAVAADESAVTVAAPAARESVSSDRPGGSPEPSSSSSRGRVVMAAQPSLRIRTRQRSFWGRVLDWLSGR
ncbi:MAG: GTPase domain-containing protein [candidate division Zixibacteria bacterium]|nr:GTPase domain-containing protein [candidate division Zixibacteria bacterium]